MTNPILQQLLSATSPLSVCWLGNDGWLLCGQGRLIAFDLDLQSPTRLRPSPIAAEELAPALEALFISHEHGDHFHDATAASLAKQSKCQFVVPANCAAKARSLGIPEGRITIARPRQPLHVLGLPVLPTRAFHGHLLQSVYHEANLDDCGYVIDMAGLKVFQPGDSVLTQEHLEMTGLDVLFVSPTEHNMHIRPAAALIEVLQPRWIFPQHFDTYAVTPANSFWTVGYPDELRAALTPELQNCYHKLAAGEVFAMVPG
jgi:L-ascorbate 6-phosphate lactonase